MRLLDYLAKTCTTRRELRHLQWIHGKAAAWSLQEKVRNESAILFKNWEFFVRQNGFFPGRELPPPHLMNDTEKSMFIAETPRYASKDDSIRKKNFSIPPFLEINVKKELSFFLNLHERAMFCIVREKFLNSQFEIGDCVAGIEENPEFLLGKIVILQNLSDELFLCRLLKVEKNIATVFLNTKNPSVSMEFRKIARVIWHRKSKF